MCMANSVGDTYVEYYEKEDQTKPGQPAFSLGYRTCKSSFCGIFLFCLPGCSGQIAGPGSSNFSCLIPNFPIATVFSIKFNFSMSTFFKKVFLKGIKFFLILQTVMT